MAELKKLWLVSDLPKGMTVEELFEDDAIQDDEHRLQHFCGALGDDGPYSFDKLLRVVFGTPGGIAGVFAENPKLYGDEASARADADKRFAKARKAYERTKHASSDDLVQRVASRFQNG